MYRSYLTPRRGAVSTYAARTKSARVYRGKPRWTAVRRRQVVPLKAEGELKGVDTALTYAPVIATTNTNAGIFPVNLVTPGSGPQNRIGRKIRLKSLRVKATVFARYAETTTTLSLNGNILRMLVVYDKQPSGVLPALDAIIGRQAQDGTESADVLDNLRFDNTDRFRIVRDVVITCPVQARPAEGGTEDLVTNLYQVDEYIRLNLPTQFSGQTDPTTIADMSSGALYVIFRAVLQTGQAYIDISEESTARLRYTDF